CSCDVTYPRVGRGVCDRLALQLTASYNQLGAVRCQAREEAISTSRSSCHVERSETSLIIVCALPEEINRDSSLRSEWQGHTTTLRRAEIELRPSRSCET